MKHLNIVQLLFRFRSFAQDVVDTVHKTEKLISGHVIHKLAEHDERLTRIEDKVDTIIEKL